MTTASAYPLSWPQGFPRHAHTRDKGAFSATLSKALGNVEASLRLFAKDSGKKLESVVISSNVTLGATRPSDPGVAVWFTWDGLGVCIAVDRYSSIEANLQAIHHILEARRVELRHGTLALVRASFSGFKALPAPPGSQWWEVLGVAPDAQSYDIKFAYDRERAKAHPDKPGGTHERFVAVEAAFKQAKLEGRA